MKVNMNDMLSTTQQLGGKPGNGTALLSIEHSLSMQRNINSMKARVGSYINPTVETHKQALLVSQQRDQRSHERSLSKENDRLNGRLSQIKNVSALYRRLIIVCSYLESDQAAATAPAGISLLRPKKTGAQEDKP